MNLNRAAGRKTLAALGLAWAIASCGSDEGTPGGDDGGRGGEGAYAGAAGAESADAGDANAADGGTAGAAGTASTDGGDRAASGGEEAEGGESTNGGASEDGGASEQGGAAENGGAPENGGATGSAGAPDFGAGGAPSSESACFDGADDDGDGDTDCADPDCDDAVCRPETSVCDVAEMCSGGACPADEAAPEGTECRDAAGPCDVAEVCDGVSRACPVDQVTPPGFVCRESAGPCDLPDECNGVGSACPTNAFEPADTPCREPQGVCDEEALCTGSTATCPTNPFLPSNVVCREAEGACDAPETCSGDDPDCPADELRGPTEVCRPAAGSCDPVAEDCTGESVDCPADDNDCPAGQWCSGTTCEDQLANGESCTLSEECDSGYCVDDVCCDTTCSGPCKACNLAANPGTCTNRGGGGDPENGCGLYDCNAQGTCNTSCVNTCGNACKGTAYCSAGKCVSDRPNGASCSAGCQCPGARCVDGVCCNTTCTGTCESCDLPDSAGTCTDHPEWSDPTNECLAGMCDGANACTACGDIDDATLEDLVAGLLEDVTNDEYCAVGPRRHILPNPPWSIFVADVCHQPVCTSTPMPGCAMEGGAPDIFNVDPATYQVDATVIVNLTMPVLQGGCTFTGGLLTTIRATVVIDEGDDGYSLAFEEVEVFVGPIPTDPEGCALAPVLLSFLIVLAEEYVDVLTDRLEDASLPFCE